MSKEKPYRYLIYVLLEMVRRIFLILPRTAGYGLATCLGLSVYWILYQERVKMTLHLKQAFGGEKSEDEIERIARGTFVHLAHSAVDVFRFPKLNRALVERLVFLDGDRRKLDEVLAQGNGAIVLTGHIGNWELLASYFRFLGYPGCLVGRRIYYEPYDRVLVSLRRSALVETVYRDESPRKVLAELRANHVVGLSADQDIDRVEGIFVPFFGKDSWTAVGPAKIAWASGAALVPAFMIHEGDHYRLFIEDPIWPEENAEKREVVQRMTEAWSRIVEKYVRLYPDQWVWMHNRWKTGSEPAVKPKEVAQYAV